MPTPGHGEKLTRKQELAIAALLEEPTILRAATRARVSERTLRTWLRQPGFQAEFRAAKRAVVEGAITRLQQTALEAVLSLSRNLDCHQPSVEVAAAKAVLEYTFRGVEFLNLVHEVEELKRQVEELTDRAPYPLPPALPTPPPPGPAEPTAEPAAGPHPGGPGGDLPGGGDDAGPLADAPPLFPGA
jgi:hypothetical protein